MADKVTLQQVMKAVASWTLRFPETKYSPQQLKLIAQEYHEDLVDEHVTTGEFAEAAKEVRKRARWFPKMVDILGAVNERRQRHEQTMCGKIMIEGKTSRHDLTPEEVDANRRRVKAITDMLAGKLSIQDAEKAVVAPEVFRGRMFASDSGGQ